MSRFDEAKHEIAQKARAQRAFVAGEGGKTPEVRNTCPHCGTAIEVVPDISGRTVVVDAAVTDFVVSYPSGYVRMRQGRRVHSCAMTGEAGHVVK